MSIRINGRLLCAFCDEFLPKDTKKSFGPVQMTGVDKNGRYFSRSGRVCEKCAKKLSNKDK